MYKVLFSDQTEFIGGAPENSLWNEMPDKPIASLQYSIFGVSLVLKGFESYNHILEKIVICNAPQKFLKASHGISKIIVMAQWQSKTYQIIYDLLKGRVFQKIEIVNSLYSGWKKGGYDPGTLPKINLG